VREKREKAKKVKTSGDVVGSNGHIGVDERFAARSANQYLKREGAAKLDTSRIGNPNLIYESRLVESWEPTGVPDGVEVTRCLGEEDSSS
jgi:catechol O-methyltransferase